MSTFSHIHSDGYAFVWSQTLIFSGIFLIFSLFIEHAVCIVSKGLQTIIVHESLLSILQIGKMNFNEPFQSFRKYTMRNGNTYFLLT